MKTVHKYVLEVKDYAEVKMPDGAKILHLAEQNGQLCLWALVDTKKPAKTRTFRIAGTGHPIKEGSVPYIESVLMHRGTLVLHVFQVA